MLYDVRAPALIHVLPLAFVNQATSAEFLLIADVRRVRVPCVLACSCNRLCGCVGLQGLLGDAKTFKLEFEKRITAGNDKNATGRDRQIATAKAAELRARIAPFFLRREKKDVLASNDRYIHDMSEIS